MSETMSVVLVVVILLNVAAFLWLMYATGKKRVGEVAEGAVKDHVWDDDLRELNNPMPRWWLNLFILTIVFSLGYWIAYPGLGGFAGVLDWSSEREMEADLATYQARRAQFLQQFEGRDMAALVQDPVARERGEKLFGQYCAGCHGARARGAIGYPNLADADWLYGGAPEQVLASIRNGRAGYMMPFSETLSAEEVDALVLLLSNWPQQARPGALGMRVFQKQCAGCHGADGRGNVQVGAPNLTDAIWLYGGSEDALRRTILQGRNGNMPAQSELLTETEMQLLTAWLLGLAG